MSYHFCFLRNRILPLVLKIYSLQCKFYCRNHYFLGAKVVLKLLKYELSLFLSLCKKIRRGSTNKRREAVCLIIETRVSNVAEETFFYLICHLMIIANSALRASLAIYHLISNARSWNNCLLKLDAKVVQ